MLRLLGKTQPCNETLDPEWTNDDKQGFFSDEVDELPKRALSSSSSSSSSSFLILLHVLLTRWITPVQDVLCVFDVPTSEVEARQHELIGMLRKMRKKPAHLSNELSMFRFVILLCYE